MIITTHKGTKTPCEINSASGHISINWPSPIDRSSNTSEKTLQIIKYSIEFFQQYIKIPIKKRID
jgi:hypothetical protein